MAKTKKLSLRERIDICIDEIGVVIDNGVSERKETLLLRIVDCLRDAAIVIDIKDLEARNSAINLLIAKVDGQKAALEAAHDNVKATTDALAKVAKVVNALGGLISKLPK